MNDHLKLSKDGNKKSKVNKSRTMVRLISAICVIVLVLTCCIGCTSHVTTEEFDALKNELSDEIDSLIDSNEAVRQELETLKTKYDAAQKELDELKKKEQAAQTEIDSLKSGNQSLTNELSSVKSDYDSAKDEINSLKESNTEAKAEIDALKGSNTAAQQEIASLKNNNASTQQEINALKSEYESAQQEIERLKEQIEELKGNPPTEEPTEKIKIYIDQGHNPSSYHNSGAEGNGYYEQDLTFTIGILLAELLEEDGRFEVLLSRPTEDTVLGTNTDTSLDARVQGAKDFGADYFISLHINSFTDSTVTGIEVYAAENGTTSYSFGSALLQGMIDSTQLNNRGMKLNPELRVLKNATMPAVLLEMGFISNADDARLLAEHPELFAQGIYDGILDYFELSENTTSQN